MKGIRPDVWTAQGIVDPDDADFFFKEKSNNKRIKFLQSDLNSFDLSCSHDERNLFETITLCDDWCETGSLIEFKDVKKFENSKYLYYSRGRNFVEDKKQINK